MAINPNEPVDAVVMWVDGSDPEFVDSQNYYLKANNRPIVNSAERHRDNGELRYVLRGLIHHTPWIRRIHVVLMVKSHHGLFLIVKGLFISSTKISFQKPI